MKKLIVKLVIATVLMVGVVSATNVGSGVKESAGNTVEIQRNPGGNGGIGDN